MSARSSDPNEPNNIEPAESPVTAPRRPRRRVDPDGDTLHTNSPLKKPSPAPETADDVFQTPAQEPGAATQPFPAAHAAPPQPADLPTEPLEDSFEDAASARAKARERAAVGSPVAAVVMQVVLAILAPLIILIAALRVVASPAFLWFEYHRPGFPADQYGMDTEQRLAAGSYGLDYLFNLAPASYLGELTFANGNPMFTAAEVGHMADVKQVMLWVTVAGVVAAIACIVMMIMLSRMRKGAIARALFAGAIWFTVALILVAILAVVGWEAFFAGFHQLFFADGTWTFYTTDTLIRLYPAQFWVDAAAWVAGLSLVTMVVILVCTAPTRRRRYRAAQSQRFMESQVMADVRTDQP